MQNTNDIEDDIYIDDTEGQESQNSEIPIAVKNKITSMGMIFLSTGFLSLAIGFQNKMLLFIVTGFFTVGFGLFSMIQMYVLAKSNKMLEITGVVVDIDKEGYRKQNTYLYIKTIERVTYKIFAVDKKAAKYKKGTIVSFYTTQKAIDESFKDGVYEIPTVFAIARVDLRDEEKYDEEVAAAFDTLKDRAERKKSAEEQDM